MLIAYHQAGIVMAAQAFARLDRLKQGHAAMAEHKKEHALARAAGALGEAAQEKALARQEKKDLAEIAEQKHAAPRTTGAAAKIKVAARLDKQKQGHVLLAAFQE